MDYTAAALNAFDIRYVKLHFTVRFLEDTVMPVYKASGIRGGIGEMLLRANCIRDRKCEQCDFEPECIVRRIMYSKMEIQPAFMSAGDSVGYVIECEDYHDSFLKGDDMRFHLLLFGKTIVYFNQILSAIYALGTYGIGKERSKYEIISIKNTVNREILDGYNVLMKEYRVMTVADYIAYRKKIIEQTGLNGYIKFQTPLTLKFRGMAMDSFQIRPIYEAILRRVYILNCFEGKQADVRSLGGRENYPSVQNEEHHGISVRRWSNHKKSSMCLTGIEGWMRLSEIPDDMTDVLLAGELIHIGKNTSFGFGRYRIE